jgi:hypothetical protein
VWLVACYLCWLVWIYSSPGILHALSFCCTLYSIVSYSLYFGVIRADVTLSSSRPHDPTAHRYNLHSTLSLFHTTSIASSPCSRCIPSIRCSPLSLPLPYHIFTIHTHIRIIFGYITCSPRNHERSGVNYRGFQKCVDPFDWRLVGFSGPNCYRRCFQTCHLELSRTPQHERS